MQTAVPGVELGAVCVFESPAWCCRSNLVGLLAVGPMNAGSLGLTDLPENRDVTLVGAAELADGKALRIAEDELRQKLTRLGVRI